MEKDIFDSWLVNKYVAHRGLHDKNTPENSLPAFEKAVENSYVIELDVRPLLDGTPVVFHDETMFRMTGRDGYISQIKNNEELKTYHLGDTEYTIPTLSEALDTVAGRTEIIVEIKDNGASPTFEKNVYDVLKEYKGEYAVMSFNPFVLKWFKQNAPHIWRGQLSCYFKDIKMSFFRKQILKKMKLNKRVSCPDFIAYKWDEVPNRFVNKYKNLPLLVWAVRSQSEYMDVVPHCDNIIFEKFRPRI